MYGEELTEEIMTDMEKPDNAFRYYSFPNCFDCENCETFSDCHYFKVLGFVRKIREEYSKNIPSQNCLSETFNRL